jgi:hypothetical protein
MDTPPAPGPHWALWILLAAGIALVLTLAPLLKDLLGW